MEPPAAQRHGTDQSNPAPGALFAVHRRLEHIEARLAAIEESMRIAAEHRSAVDPLFSEIKGAFGEMGSAITVIDGALQGMARRNRERLDRLGELSRPEGDEAGPAP